MKNYPFHFKATSIFTIFILVLFITKSNSQSYLGWTTANVNLRQGPGTNYEKVALLQAGSQIFIISDQTDDDFYNVIDIASDREGFVHKSYVRFGKEVEKNEKGFFVPSGTSSQINPELEVFNNTNLTLRLKLNGALYVFSSKETKNITIPPGTCEYFASAPGVLPSYGTEVMKSNTVYTWQFYVVTERR